MINRKVNYFRGISGYIYNNLDRYYELLGKENLDNLDEWNKFINDANYKEYFIQINNLYKSFIEI